MKKIILFALLLVNAVESFNATAFFDDRVLTVKQDNNTYNNVVLATSVGHAVSKMRAVYGNCENEKFSKVDLHCHVYPASEICKTLKTIGLSTGRYDWFVSKTKQCNCQAGCEKHSGKKYPGCTCGLKQIINFKDSACDWTLNATGTENFEFEAVNIDMFDSYAELTPEKNPGYAIAKIESVKYAQSGHLCKLNFGYHLEDYNNVIIKVEALLDGNQTVPLWKSDSTTYRFNNAEVQLGSFSKPFKVIISAESVDDGGVRLRRRNRESSEYNSFKIKNITFNGCEVDGRFVNECNMGSKRMCATENNVKCLVDVACDLKNDCPDGSDEVGCEGMIAGTQCNFNKRDEICPGWNQITRTVRDIRTHHLKPEVISDSPSGENREALMKVVYPSQFTHPSATPDSGSILAYSSRQIGTKNLTSRESVLVSPLFPPTNPLAYDPENPIFGSCSLKFFYCSRTYITKWHIAVLAKHEDVFEGKMTTLQRQKQNYHQTDDCTWQRGSIAIPRQNFQFRLVISLTSGSERDAVLALEDLTLSPSCFPEGNKTIPLNSILITSCNNTGAWQPTDCRIKVCGASGGNSRNRKGKPGSCVTTISFIRDGQRMKFAIGQRGESPCSKLGTSFTMYDDSCEESEYDNMQVRRRDGGAAGGGASTLSFDKGKSWQIIGAGGGGASYDVTGENEISDDLKESGYGFSINGTIEGKCDSNCREATATSNTKFGQCKVLEVTIKGGFGGGGSSCDSNGGGGAGRVGGSSGELGDGETGSSYVDGEIARESSMAEVNENADGFVSIVPCQKKCDEPSICLFRSVNSTEEICGCPDGHDPENGTCVCHLDCPMDSTCVLNDFTMLPECQCSNGTMIDVGGSCTATANNKIDLVYAAIFISLLALGVFKVVLMYRRKNKNLYRELEEVKNNLERVRIYDRNYFGTELRSEVLKKLEKVSTEELNYTDSRLLGSGNFGHVITAGYKKSGESRERTVAIKMITTETTRELANYDKHDFCNEAMCLGTFVDPNIVSLIGVQLDDNPYLIIMEHMLGGNMHSFVFDSRPSHTDLNPFQLTMKDLVMLALDTAKGCRCIEKYNYVHRDIAARNILLTHRGPGRVAKLADFGLAKELATEYYRSGRSTFPIKWTPPEALVDNVFTNKSDVWSFGVTCWEIFSLGVVPYANISNETTKMMVIDGQRLMFPFGCPAKIYELMRSCWKTDPEERPTFEELVVTLEELVEDEDTITLPFPVHPVIMVSFLANSTPVGTPLTASTDASSLSIEDHHAEKMLELAQKREPQFISNFTREAIFRNIMRTIRPEGFPTSTLLATPESIVSLPIPSPIDNNEPQKNCYELLEKTTEKESLHTMAVQNTGPQIERPENLNINL